MEPKYSVLLFNQNINEFKTKIDLWLHTGIKIFWFGKINEKHELESCFEPFASAFFLQCFTVSSAHKAVIIDGKDSNDVVKNLGKQVPAFNAEQYMVEHCSAENHITVEASAGTGKTTVMIDRVMFLLHTVKDLEPSDICMITFTNDATNQMNDRLQQIILKKYMLTGNTRYLIWLEKQSQMHISTIHSFAYSLLKNYGIEAGFSNNIKLRSFNYERKELIKDRINGMVSGKRNVHSQIGLSFYRETETLDKYWKRFAQLGYTKEEIIGMDWGKCEGEDSKKFQKTAISVFEELDDDYFEAKQKNNAVSVNDILRDLWKVFEDTGNELPDLNIRYLFVDEFQDSDNSQIKILSWIVKNAGTRLFVVGDIKQSIYRFRGANDTAFLTLLKYLDEVNSNDKPCSFSLVNNYRTSDNVLREMDRYFKCWSKSGFLSYSQSVTALNTEKGVIKMIPSAGSRNIEGQFCDVAEKALDDLNMRLYSAHRKLKKSDRVAVLCRSNSQLNRIYDICSDNHIPAIVKREGSFYKSEAVRDFYAMISSFTFPGEPKYIFNYLTGPYADSGEPLDMYKLEDADGDRKKLNRYLKTMLDKTKWDKYYKDFQLYPVMSVIRKILETDRIEDRYISKLKCRRINSGWPVSEINSGITVMAKQYRANLDKLMEILHRNTSGEFTSLYDIYSFLKISIETNRDEEEAEILDADDSHCLNCMTVHKAKGLEFDTVIIPYTDMPLYRSRDTEILISNDNTRIGWKYRDKKTGKTLSNSCYDDLQQEEEQNAFHEETRILYVAMTRAIHSLYCLVAPDKKEASWAHLIRRAGISNE